MKRVMMLVMVISMLGIALVASAEPVKIGMITTLSTKAAYLGEDIRDDLERLRKLLRTTAHGAALVELIYGQLLMSRRLRGARLHLDRGFLRAGRLLTTDDYFILLKRHQQLSRLPLTQTPLPPADLPSLLTTAAVIARMAPHCNNPTEWDAEDING